MAVPLHSRTCQSQIQLGRNPSLPILDYSNSESLDGIVFSLNT